MQVQNICQHNLQNKQCYDDIQPGFWTRRRPAATAPQPAAGSARPGHDQLLAVGAAVDDPAPLVLTAASSSLMMRSGEPVSERFLPSAACNIGGDVMSPRIR